MQPRLVCAVAIACGLASSVAVAAPRVTVAPARAKPGDAVLVTVRDTRQPPKGTADGKPLEFFRARNGYQALFAIPLDAEPQRIAIHVRGARKTSVAVREIVFPEASVVVEEEYANPPPAERARIDDDNRKMIEAMTKDNDGRPQFTRAFRRPRGKTMSPFGEWRTFNDGHRSQHLGMDVFAREGTRVRAINRGTVTFVGETFLAGNVVVVAHGAGIASAYFHLSATNVERGQNVEAGDEVGRAGQTGRTTGPHLHLAVRVAGGFVDPATFFRLRLEPAPVPERAARRKR